MFTAPELTDYLRTHIPVSGAMGLAVRTVDWTQIAIDFPLQPNLNHNATAFGGSLSSALMLAGWSLAHTRLRHLDYDTVLVVSRSETRFLRPADADFVAHCEHHDDHAWDFFRECLDRKGRAKLRLKTRVERDGQVCATMAGSFVAILRDGQAGPE